MYDLIGIEADVNDKIPRRICTVSTSISCELIIVGQNLGAWDAIIKAYKEQRKIIKNSAVPIIPPVKN